MGSVDSSDADLRVRLAASYGRAHGGLCRSVGSSSPPVDPGSPAGADDLTPITARGESHSDEEKYFLISSNYSLTAYCMLYWLYVSTSIKGIFVTC